MAVVAIAVLVVIAAVTVWGIYYALQGLATELSRRRQYEAARVDSLDGMFLPGRTASALVRSWSKGRRCVSCGGPLSESRFSAHHVALLDPSGMTREWVDVTPDRLALALATSLPVCWNCHVAATFRRTHPDLVTDRNRRRLQLEESETHDD
jgi:hypothetical protein